MPRYRQKLATPPLETGRPLWVDDPDFNIEYHIRHTALPPPGSEEQLFLLASRIASQQLDRDKPLWENWLVEGLEGDRFALISKTHHALVDGVSGVDLATVLFDLEPNPPPPQEDLEPWRPQREPSSVELVAAGVRGNVGIATGFMTRAVSAATRPVSSLGKLRDAAEGVGEIAWAGLNPAPETPLNVEIGPHRRYAVVRHQLGRLQGGQEHVRRHGQRRRADGRVRRARALAGVARAPDRGPRDAGARARVGPHRSASGHAGQPARR